MHAMFPLVLAGVMAAGAFDSVAAAVQLPEGRPIASRDNEAKQTAPESPLKRLARLELRATPLKQALEQLHLRSGVNLIYSPTRIPDVMVSCSCRERTVEEALTHMFARVPLSFDVADSDVIIVPVIATQAAAAAEPDVSPVQRVAQVQPVDAAVVERTKAKRVVGAISGRVIDAASGQGITGASIIVEGTSHGAVTAAGGVYRITGVPAGRHTLAVDVIGYERATQTVAVVDGETANASFSLSTQAVPLDELVVTGSVVKTRVRELPSPITVLSAADIEKMAVARTDQLFRGAVAGAVAFDQGPINHYSSVLMRGTNSLSGIGLVKTYVDGVELVSPQLINTIDPETIERVEILRGPQASTMYGSDASGGVMQIFTKKGRPSARPVLTVKTGFGFFDGTWNDGKEVGQSDNAFNVSGGGEQFSYNAGVTHTWYDGYVPGGNSQNLNGVGAIRFQQGALGLGVSGRWNNKRFGNPASPPLIRAGISTRRESNEDQNQDQKSLALNATYTAASNWTHELAVGFDANHTEYYSNGRGRTSPADTLNTVYFGANSRVSARYHTSLQLDLTPNVSSTLLAGIEHNRYNQGNFASYQAGSTRGSIDPEGAYMSRDQWGNTGYFVQGNTGLFDRLFVTAGVRVEDNDNLGDEYGNAVNPRVGVAYAFSLKGVDLKARGGWGTGLNPPVAEHKAGSSFTGGRVLPNPAIGPEKVSGWDAGLELQFRDRASLGITYYDQVADDLIETVLVDGTDPVNGIAYQYQNAGKIGNSGWEVEGEVFLRPLPVTLRGTFTTMKSVMQERAAGYSGELQIGEEMIDIPEYSAGLTVSYSHSKGNVSVTATHIGPWVAIDWLAMYRYYYGMEEYRGSERAYWMDYDAVTKFSLNTSYSIRQDLEAYLSVLNIGNNTGNERNNVGTDTPRSVMVGFRYTH